MCVMSIFYSFINMVIFSGVLLVKNLYKINSGKYFVIIKVSFDVIFVSFVIG